jgi:MFS family permease
MTGTSNERICPTQRETLGGYPGRPVSGWQKGGSVPRSRAINRTQGLVLGFFAVAWIALVVMLAASAGVRDVTVHRMPGAGAPAIIGFVLALLAFLTVLAIGVLQRWRWIFWLILVAFAAGLVRVPVAVLQLSGRMVPEGPDWYVIVQGVVGVIQVAVAVAMFAGYRRSGPWGSF